MIDELIDPLGPRLIFVRAEIFFFPFFPLHLEIRMVDRRGSEFLFFSSEHGHPLHKLIFSTTITNHASIEVITRAHLPRKLQLFMTPGDLACHSFTRA